MEEINLDFLITPPRREQQQRQMERVATPLATNRLDIQHEKKTTHKKKLELAQKLAHVDELVRKNEALKRNSNELQKQLNDCQEAAQQVQQMYNEEKQQHEDVKKKLDSYKEKYDKVDIELTSKNMQYAQLEARLANYENRPIDYDELVIKFIRIIKKLDADDCLKYCHDKNLVDELTQYCRKMSLKLPVVKSPQKLKSKAAKPKTKDASVQCSNMAKLQVPISKPEMKDQYTQSQLLLEDFSNGNLEKQKSKNASIQCSSKELQHVPINKPEMKEQYTQSHLLPTVSTSLEKPSPIRRLHLKEQSTQCQTFNRRDQASQYISTMITRQTNTEKVVQRHVATMFPEPKPTPAINDILNVFCKWADIRSVTPLEDTTAGKEIKKKTLKSLNSTGTCTMLCNIRRKIDYLPPTSASSIKQELTTPSPSPLPTSTHNTTSTASRINNISQIPSSLPTNINNQNNLPNAILTLFNATSNSALGQLSATAFNELWQIFGTMLLSLLQTSNAGIANINHNSINQQQFLDWLLELYMSTQLSSNDTEIPSASQQVNSTQTTSPSPLCFNNSSVLSSSNIIRPQATKSVNKGLLASRDNNFDEPLDSMGDNHNYETSTSTNLTPSDTTAAIVENFYHDSNSMDREIQQIQATTNTTEMHNDIWESSLNPLSNTNKILKTKSGKNKNKHKLEEQIEKLFPEVKLNKSKRRTLKRLIKGGQIKKKTRKNRQDKNIINEEANEEDKPIETAVDFLKIFTQEQGNFENNEFIYKDKEAKEEELKIAENVLINNNENATLCEESEQLYSKPLTCAINNEFTFLKPQNLQHTPKSIKDSSNSTFVKPAKKSKISFTTSKVENKYKILFGDSDSEIDDEDIPKLNKMPVINSIEIVANDIKAFDGDTEYYMEEGQYNYKEQTLTASEPEYFNTPVSKTFTNVSETCPQISNSMNQEEFSIPLISTPLLENLENTSLLRNPVNILQFSNNNELFFDKLLQENQTNANNTTEQYGIIHKQNSEIDSTQAYENNSIDINKDLELSSDDDDDDEAMVEDRMDAIEKELQQYQNVTYSLNSLPILQDLTRDCQKETKPSLIVETSVTNNNSLNVCHNIRSLRNIDYNTTKLEIKPKENLKHNMEGNSYNLIPTKTIETDKPTTSKLCSVDKREFEKDFELSSDTESELTEVDNPVNNHYTFTVNDRDKSYDKNNSLSMLKHSKKDLEEEVNRDIKQKLGNNKTFNKYVENPKIRLTDSLLESKEKSIPLFKAPEFTSPERRPIYKQQFLQYFIPSRIEQDLREARQNSSVSESEDSLKTLQGFKEFEKQRGNNEALDIYVEKQKIVLTKTLNKSEENSKPLIKSPKNAIPQNRPIFKQPYSQYFIPARTEQDLRDVEVIQNSSLSESESDDSLKILKGRKNVRQDLKGFRRQRGNNEALTVYVEKQKTLPNLEKKTIPLMNSLDSISTERRQIFKQPSSQYIIPAGIEHNIKDFNTIENSLLSKSEDRLISPESRDNIEKDFKRFEKQRGNIETLNLKVEKQKIAVTDSLLESKEKCIPLIQSPESTSPERQQIFKQPLSQFFIPTSTEQDLRDVDTIQNMPLSESEESFNSLESKDNVEKDFKGFEEQKESYNSAKTERELKANEQQQTDFIEQPKENMNSEENQHFNQVQNKERPFISKTVNIEQTTDNIIESSLCTAVATPLPDFNNTFIRKRNLSNTKTSNKILNEDQIKLSDIISNEENTERTTNLCWSTIVVSDETVNNKMLNEDQKKSINISSNKENTERTTNLCWSTKNVSDETLINKILNEDQIKSSNISSKEENTERTTHFCWSTIVVSDETVSNSRLIATSEDKEMSIVEISSDVTGLDCRRSLESPIENDLIIDEDSIDITNEENDCQENMAEIDFKEKEHNYNQTKAKDLKTEHTNDTKIQHATSKNETLNTSNIEHAESKNETLNTSNISSILDSSVYKEILTESLKPLINNLINEDDILTMPSLDVRAKRGRKRKSECSPTAETQPCKRSQRLKAKQMVVEESFNLSATPTNMANMGKYTRKRKISSTVEEVIKNKNLNQIKSKDGDKVKEFKNNLQLGFFKERIIEEDTNNLYPIKIEENKKTILNGPLKNNKTPYTADNYKGKASIVKETFIQKSSDPKDPMESTEDSSIKLCPSVTDISSQIISINECSTPATPMLNTAFFEYSDSPKSPPPSTSLSIENVHNDDKLNKTYVIIPLSRKSESISQQHQQRRQDETLFDTLFNNYTIQHHGNIQPPSNKVLKAEQLVVQRLEKELKQYCYNEMELDQEHLAYKLINQLLQITDKYELIQKALLKTVKNATSLKVPVGELPSIIQEMPPRHLSVCLQRLYVALKHFLHKNANFCKELILKIEDLLFDTQQSERLSPEAILNLTQLYLLSCRQQETVELLKHPTRLFLAKCLYYYNKKAKLMVHEVLLWHPTVLPHREDSTYDRSDALITVIQQLLMNTKYDMNNEDFRDKTLLSKLRYEYHFEPFKPTLDEVIKNLVEKLDNSKFDNIFVAFGLLCKRLEPKKVQELFLRDNLLPLASQYYNKASIKLAYDTRISVLLEIISIIVKPFPLHTNVEVYLNEFARFLNGFDRPIIQEAALCAILRLQRFGCVNCYNLLRHFKPTYDLKPHTQAKLKTFMYRKSITFWKTVKSQNPTN